MASGKELQALGGTRARSAGRSFPPIGKTVLTAGEQTARLWDMANGHELRILRGHEDLVVSADRQQ